MQALLTESKESHDKKRHYTKPEKIPESTALVVI